MLLRPNGSSERSRSARTRVISPIPKISTERRRDGRSVCSWSSLISGGGPSTGLVGLVSARRANAGQQPAGETGGKHDEAGTDGEERECDEREHRQDDQARVRQRAGG